MRSFFLVIFTILAPVGHYLLNGGLGIQNAALEWEKPVTTAKQLRTNPHQPKNLQSLADSIARFLRAQNDCIPWDYPEDYCFARAHASYLLTKQSFGVELGKMYLYPHQQTSALKIRVRLPDYALYDSARWNGHVTVFLADKRDTLIIDPSLTNGAITKADYLQKLRINPQDFSIDYSSGSEYCSVCQPKYNYRGKDAQETTARALRENRLRRGVYVKETEIERSYPVCTHPLPAD